MAIFVEALNINSRSGRYPQGPGRLFLTAKPASGFFMEGRPMSKAEFNQYSLEYWPFLEILVSEVNMAILLRDKKRLNDVFIAAVNGLGMKVERQGVKLASQNCDIVKVNKELSRKLSCYKTQILIIKNMKKRIKDPIGKYGPLKETTLRQYKSNVKCWPEKRQEFKQEIKELVFKIKELSVRSSRSRVYKFKNGTVLTSWDGGKQSLLEGNYGPS